MFKKKIIPALLAGMLVVGSLSGCALNGGSGTESLTKEIGRAHV